MVYMDDGRDCFKAAIPAANEKAARKYVERMIDMKRILLLLVLCLNISMVLGQEYKNWEKYDIEGFYIIAKSKAEAKISKNVLREGADYYILTEMDDQVFPSGVSKKITPKLYKLKDTEIYIFFSFPPFLFDADNGMIEIKDNKGTFFKKPTQ